MENSIKAIILKEMMTNNGENLANLSNDTPILLIFLRHFGCTFCREALHDLSLQKDEITKLGTKIAFVHMSSYEIADDYFEKHNLQGFPHISDEKCEFYQAFGLIKGSFTQLYGLQTWIRGFSAGVVKGHGIGAKLGDDLQMPGVFLIYKEEVKESYIHKLASSRPDYFKIAQCSII